MTTRRLTPRVKTLSDFEWVRLAASTDEARPVLAAIHAENGHLEATDGHRLHIGTNSGALTQGVWMARNLVKIDGNYPNTAQVSSPRTTRRFAVRDVAGLLKLTRAGVAMYKVFRSWDYGRLTFPAADETRLTVSAIYIRDILLGAVDLQVSVNLGTPLTPMRWELGGDRIAVVMPIRADCERGADLRADEYLVEEEIVEEPAPPAKGKRKSKAAVA